MPTIVATPGASNANSYETLAELKTYIGERLHVPASVSAATDPTLETALIMATRGLNQILTKYRRLEILTTSRVTEKFYVTRPYWTGYVASSTQKLAWPRTSMFDRNGNAIAEDVIPQDLKDATSEMAILVVTTDLTADNAIITQGITDLTAGPVSLSFRDYIQKRILPESVLLALVPTWITDERYEPALRAQFATLGTDDGRR